MDEETEENMRLRFLAIEKSVHELMLNQYGQKELYRIEFEISEMRSKFLLNEFYVKEVEKQLKRAEQLHVNYKSFICMSLLFCAFMCFVLLITTN